MTEEEIVEMCKYCGKSKEEGQHSACEHSNSAYVEVNKSEIEIERRTMKHGNCSCGRSGMLYKGKCYFCYVEETREIAENLQEMIREEGRSNLISIDKMKLTRDKLLELV